MAKPDAMTLPLRRPSGNKYKKCGLAKEERPRATAMFEAQPGGAINPPLRIAMRRRGASPARR